MLIHLQFLKKTTHKQFYNADVSQVDLCPHTEKANLCHGINSHHNDNVSLLCELITVNSYSED